ncbi:head GIN domain-containing protein [Undibacterium sp. Di27W]|uniref:head GIN domain-containing protein n=1 Tax=Undibacterium sp. Di27W TaxID=3413036 RepID=UPI003BF5D480
MLKNQNSRRYVLASLLALVSLPAAADWSGGWGWSKGKGIEGSGNIQKQDRNVTGYSSVDLALPAKLELRQGDKEGVQVETDDNLLALVETVVESGHLKIRNAEKNTYPKTKTLNIIVYCKNLDKIAVSGSGKIWTDKLAAKELQTKIGGSGDIQIKALQADSLSVAIGGNGNFMAAGTAAEFNGKIGGYGDIQVGKLEASNVKIKIGGSGIAQVWAKEKLDVSIGGSGDVSYYGDPKLSKSIHGSGKVTRKGDMPG